MCESLTEDQRWYLYWFGKAGKAKREPEDDKDNDWIDEEWDDEEDLPKKKRRSE